MPRFRVLLYAACAGLSLVTAHAAHAQGRGGGGAPPQQDEDDAKKKKRDEAFGNLTAPLPELKNAGPCPFVKVLYDAARYVEFKDDKEASASVAYTGEIQNLSSTCAYKGDEPITVKARVLFALGKGPQATSRGKVYHYWVAVTDRNHAVLNKVDFNLPVTFPGDNDRVEATEEINRIIIPRKDNGVSGANFEVLVGFDVTPKMAEFNREGKRFRPTAGQVSRDAAAKP